MQRETDDLVEIQQLLARYAVTITQGDIDGLIGVFTPDGHSAFGDTYRLDRFPEFVDAAPRLVPHRDGAGRPRGRCRERHPAVVLYRARHTRYANRLLPRHLLADADGWRLENPCHDVHSAQRGACTPGAHMPSGVPRRGCSSSSARTCARGSTRTHWTPGPTTRCTTMRQLARVHRARRPR